MNSTKNSMILKTSFKYLFALIIASTLVLQSCKDDCEDPSNPECCNYDPCYNQESTSAYFIIEESLGDHWIECDTVVGIGNVSSVRFTALHEADSFIWTLGSEIIREKSFIRNSFPSDRRISVSLITIRNNPNTSCFPKDDGRDTFRRVMYTWPREFYYDSVERKYIVDNPMPIQGTYQGYFASAPNNLVEISLQDTVYRCTKIDLNSSFMGLNCKNLPIGYFSPLLDDDNCGFFGGGWTKRPLAAYLSPRIYRERSYSSSSFNRDSIVLLKGLAHLSRDLKEIEINFNYYPVWDEINKVKIREDKFIGKKLD